MSVTKYIDNRWNLDGDKHKDVNVIDLEKKQFAYRVWKKDFKNNQKREDRQESEIKDTWTEVYQLIGFDNVFQGVWFQGVTQLAAQRGCRFSAIPIILSAFVSLVTILAVFLKISKVQGLVKSLHKDRIHSTGLQSCINQCELRGVNFEFDTLESAVAHSTVVVGIKFDEESVKSARKCSILLVSLTIASILFAWLIHLIMCGKYV